MRCKFIGCFSARKDWISLTFLRSGLLLWCGWWGVCRQNLKSGSHPGCYCNSPGMTQCWLDGDGCSGSCEKWWDFSPDRGLHCSDILSTVGRLYTPVAGEVRLPALSCQPSLGKESSKEPPAPFLGQPKHNDRLIQGYKNLALWIQGRALKDCSSIRVPCRIGNFSLCSSCFCFFPHMGVDPISTF